MLSNASSADLDIPMTRAEHKRRRIFDAYLKPHRLVEMRAFGGDVLPAGLPPFDPELDQPAARRWLRRDYAGLNKEVPEILSPDRQWFASVKTSNILLRPVGSKDEHRLLTIDGTNERYWDLEALRTKIDSGRRLGVRGVTPWSPDSQILFAYRRDLTGVYRAPVLVSDGRHDRVNFVPMQKPGGALDCVQPFFLAVNDGSRFAIVLPGDGHDYVQLLGWLPSGNQAALISYRRDFCRLSIFLAHREFGRARLILCEESAHFVKIWHDAVFAGDHGFTMLPEDKGFLWLSTRSGANQIYTIDWAGRCAGALTDHLAQVEAIQHVSGDGFVYFTAALDDARPYDIHVARVPLAGGAVERLSEAPGLHKPMFLSDDETGFLDFHSAVDRPPRIDRVSRDGCLRETIGAASIATLEQIGYRAPEEFQILAVDGATQLWGVLFKPHDFDPARCYPVVQYLYAGPQTIETPRYFPADPTALPSMALPWALAQMDYIVFCIDARGTPGRGRAFHDVVCDDWGAGLADHYSALEQLCARHDWMDGSRAGIFGHSWGGYFATRAILDRPDLYRACFAYAPAYDPWDLVHYEAYLGMPAENAAKYEAADLLKRAPELRRPLTILVGSADISVAPSAIRISRALIDAGVDHELVVIPGAGHHMVGAEERYLGDKLIGFFAHHLGGAAE